MTDYIQQQFDYAQAHGWLDFFDKAGKDYEFDPSLLMAIASRESNMQNIVGDHGHGFGCMQVDVRTDPEFCYSGAWRNPALAIQRGTQILDSKRTTIEHSVDKELNIGGVTFTGAKIASKDMTKIIVAAYNSGLWSYYNYSRGKDPDAATTGHNYAADVLKRQQEFETLLTAWNSKGSETHIQGTSK